LGTPTSIPALMAGTGRCCPMAPTPDSDEARTLERQLERVSQARPAIWWFLAAQYMPGYANPLEAEDSPPVTIRLNLVISAPHP